MLRNYLLVAIRNLIRNKVFSLINIAGLALGLSTCFVIYQYIHFEQSYDQFHADADRIYRIPIEYTGNFSTLQFSATNHPAVGPALKADFPEVEDFTRLVRLSLYTNAAALAYEPPSGDAVAFNEGKIYVADPSFLTMFSFTMKEGAAATALKDPSSIVLTESIARKYFGDQPALGKELKLNGDNLMKVTAVLKDIPENSHLQFDILISFNIMSEKWGYDIWGWPEFYNYIKLKEGTDPKQVEAKLPAFREKYLGERMKQYKFQSKFHLQPLTDIHLKSNFSQEQSPNGSERTVYFLSLLAAFILIIAWINYINLSTSKSLERSKEVGLRKVVGAHKYQLVSQFFFDALLVNLLALFISLGTIPFSLNWLGNVVGKDIAGFVYTSGWWYSSSFWVLVPAVVLGGVLLAGLYPALVFSSFKPAVVLKGKFFKSQSGIAIRKYMVSFQYILSIFLVAGTITIYRQLAYMDKIDVGYAKDQILVLKTPAVYDSTINEKINYLKNELKQYPVVKDVSVSSEIPGHAIADRNKIRRLTQDPGDGFMTYIQSIDHDFTSTFGVDVIAGRTFEEGESMSPVFGFNRGPAKPVKVVLNESAAAGLGYETPEAAVHEKIAFAYGSGEHIAEVVGVVKNYHQTSLKEKYKSILYIYPGDVTWRYISLRVDTDDLSNSLASFEKTYESAFPGGVFDYFFLNDHFNSQYKADQQFAAIFTTFTLLAILVSCLGLLGLSIFATTQRTKEIGIRKVLGASFTTILMLFSKDSVRILIVSYLIAVPAIYFAASQWLNNFAFHTGMGWEIYILPPLGLLLISLGTICAVCLRTAFINPSISLRQE
ncbi:ABC transporter permease [Ohtaekwangia kribbensis]|uniref:ABC transporter permease n=1 Tax=Ohtaekwangia kribbensis TaxID=688913 RepID=A0ABW3K5L8_9BACT